MNKGLLQIDPMELKFTYELKKPSSCSVQLTNNTYDYVAFKVKTTSPKKYSVRPHVGVLMPKSTCAFIVTMQAQRAALVDMACKDKFLIQSTIVPVGTTNDDISSSLFVKDASRYVEENKLKVALISPLHSEEISPTNGDMKNGFALEKDKIFSRDEILSPEPMVKNAENKINNEELKQEKDMKLKPAKDMVSKTVKDVEEQKPKKESVLKVSKDVELNHVNDVGELKTEKEAESKLSKVVEDPKLMESIEALKVSRDVETSDKEAELKVSKGIKEMKLMESIEEMKFKLDEIESKLNEAGVTISKLTDEKLTSNQEAKILQEKIADLSNRDVRKVQVGFPLLYVCMVALICVFLGYRLPS
ncbi:vesicle-associated protein 2-2-like isoform X1 [Senna tora]|uniref:Vesicle-associated protein 2-2-like isoform X1 n=1 Tax=Senna tora TaxID=362788 RepID=A0A834SJ55_9FABA|nr:vesicle-associated protein 2-2-like isoform X1 [Senna tora]